MDWYAPLRAALFYLDPETAHHLTLETLKQISRFSFVSHPSPPTSKPRELMGLTFPNAVGLAAGLDKNAAYLGALATLGFGFIEVGTITPRAQPGNPKPRLFRLTQAQAIINRMGFNNDGIDVMLANIQHAQYQGILGINIGKNADTPFERAADDYLYCLKAAYPYAGYITINISSPNTENLRQLQKEDNLAQLLDQLKNAQRQLHQQYERYVPLVLKIAPDLDAQQIENIAQRLLDCGIDGVIATNTTTRRDLLPNLPYSNESGGLSGAPMHNLSTAVICHLNNFLKGRIPIIGVGGILSGADAQEKIAAGASLVQLYSGLIYRGPCLIRECIKTLG